MKRFSESNTEDIKILKGLEILKCYLEKLLDCVCMVSGSLCLYVMINNLITNRMNFVAPIFLYSVAVLLFLLAVEERVESRIREIHRDFFINALEAKNVQRN